MSDKPTGVFVRLHDGLLNETQIAKLCNPKRSMTESLLAIGTPVTGGDMPVITTLGTLRDPVPCVRQSDALAKLAEKDAEIARYREAMEEAQEYARKGSWSRAHVALHKAMKGPEA